MNQDPPHLLKERGLVSPLLGNPDFCLWAAFGIRGLLVPPFLPNEFLIGMPESVSAASKQCGNMKIVDNYILF